MRTMHLMKTILLIQYFQEYRSLKIMEEWLGCLQGREGQRGVKRRKQERGSNRRGAGEVTSTTNRLFQKEFGASSHTIARLALQKKLKGHRGCVNTLAFNSTGDKLISGSDDLHVKIWDPYECKLIHSLHTNHSANIFWFSLNLWDIGGQKSLRSYWRNYFEQTDGIIWVVDCADRRRLEDCRTELHNLLQEEKLAGASLLVYANKQDLSGALSEEEIIRVLGLDDIKGRHWHIQPCSAFSGAGLQEGIEWLVSDTAARVFMLQ